LPLDDSLTYDVFQKADTNGTLMMESAWDKYDLLQVKPKDFNELTATIAMSHGLAVNPYLYTYIKIENIKPFTYPRFIEMPKVKEILSDSRGMLLWKEQRDEILDYIDSLSDEEKLLYRMPIKIVQREIELRSGSLSNRQFFRKRALICYKLAYVKAHYPDDFEKVRQVIM
jgi:DNA polymerase-3 subunit alpha